MGKIEVETNQMKCKVTEIYSPAHFSVIPCSLNSNLISLKNELKEFASNALPVKVALDVDDEVITFVKSSGDWERAVVWKPSVVKESALKHYLKLVDLGISISTSVVYISPRSFFKKVPFASFQFRLNGILPKSTSFENCKWTADTYNWVKALILLATVKLQIVCTDDKYTYGDALVPYKGELRLLSRLLLKANRAVYNEEVFMKKYGTQISHKTEEKHVAEDTDESSDESFVSATCEEQFDLKPFDNLGACLYTTNSSNENQSKTDDDNYDDCSSENDITNVAQSIQKVEPRVRLWKKSPDFKAKSSNHTSERHNKNKSDLSPSYGAVQNHPSVVKLRETSDPQQRHEKQNLSVKPNVTIMRDNMQVDNKNIDLITPHAELQDVKRNSNASIKNSHSPPNNNKRSIVGECSKNSLTKPIQDFFKHFSSASSSVSLDKSNDSCNFSSSIASSKSLIEESQLNGVISAQKCSNVSLSAFNKKKANGQVNILHCLESSEDNSEISSSLNKKSVNSFKSRSVAGSACKMETKESTEKNSVIEEEIKPFVPAPRLEEIESKLKRHFRIVVRSSFGNITPVTRLQDLPVNEYISSVLRREKFSELFPVQIYCISCIVKGHNTAIISSYKSGKTFGYVIPIMDSLHQQSENNSIPSGYGPLVIILCSGSKNIDKVQSMCKKYNNLNSFAGRVRTRILSMHGNNEKTKLDPLTQGCEVLITTPHCLVRTLRGELATNLERLQYFIIDNSDFLLEPPFESEIQALLKKMQNVSKFRKIQWIFSGENFTPKLFAVLQSLKDYTLIIGSHIEAALFAKVKPTIVFSSKDKKMESLLGILDPIQSKERIVIVCRSGAEALLVGNELKRREMSPIIAHTEMSHIELSVNEEWNTSTHPVLVCSDSILGLLNVYDATTLIHYSLPAKSKATFGLRFSVLMAHYRDHFNDVNAKVQLRSITLLDEETQKQIPHIVKDLLKLGCKVDEKILTYSEQVKTEVEVSKPITGLCENLLTMGYCVSEGSCPGRHRLAQTMDLTEHYKYGQIIFKPLRVLSGNSFAALLISNTSVDGKIVHYENLIPKITSEMEEYYGNSANRCQLGNIKVGDLCAVCTTTETFFRARIEQFLKFDAYNEPVIVRIRLIDDGTSIRISVDQLWELPNDLTYYPDQAIIAYIMDIAPIDFDSSWSHETSNALGDLLLAPLHKNSRWEATVRFSLRTAAIIDKVRLVHNLPEHHSTVNEIPINEILIKKGMAVSNPNHCSVLSQLHEKAGIEIQKFVGKKLRIEQKYAHFASENLICVIFSASRGTDCIYLKNHQCTKLLKDVEDLCCLEGEAILKKMKKYLVKPGHLCLAKNNESGEWNRAEVRKVENEVATCFFVDYGDDGDIPLTNLTPISEKLVTKLPFQAIKCSLGGVQHPDPCPDSVVDLIYDFSRDGLDELFVQYQPRENESSTYVINLINSSGKSLNKQLVESGVLKAADDAGIFLEDIEMLDITAMKEKDEEAEDYDDEDDGEEKEESAELDLSLDINGDKEGVKTELIDARSSWSEEQMSKLKRSNSTDFLNAVSNLLLEEGMEEQDFVNLLMLAKGPKEDTSKHLEIKEVNVSIMNNNNVTKSSRSECVENIEEMQSDEVTESIELCTNVNGDQYIEEDCEGWILQKPKLGLKPLIQWSQDSYYIKLKFAVIGVKEVYVAAAPRNYFATLFTESGARYTSNCEFFGAVRHMEITKQITPFCCYLVFPKSIIKLWPRLLLCTSKNMHISMDPDSLTFGESSDLNATAFNVSIPDSNYVDTSSKDKIRVDFDSDDSWNDEEDENLIEI